MNRIRALIILLATAWQLWRDGFDPACLEDDDDYDVPYLSPAEHLIVLSVATDQRDESHNAVHFNDARRRVH